MDEMISRAAVIDVINESNSPIAEYLIGEIMALPSAQPEKRTGTHACDLIDRAEAIDALVKDCKASDEGMLNMYDIVCDLKDVPSAQPSSSCSHEKDVQPGPEEPFEKCSDCIHAHDSEDICVLRRCKHAIAETVECFEPKQHERKRGKWKGYNMDKGGWKRTDGSPVFLICSECGGTVLNNGSAYWNYCPHCGSEMDEWDDERSD